MTILPYNNETVNKIYSDNQDFIDEINSAVEKYSERTKRIYEFYDKVHKEYQRVNKDIYDELDKITRKEVKRIKELPRFQKFYKTNSKFHKIDLDTLIMFIETGACRPDIVDLKIKFGSKDYLNTCDELYSKIKSERQIEEDFKAKGEYYE